MFDDHRVEFKSPEKIFHKYERAPTEDSIRLAKEYEEKILDKITEKFHSFNNKINISFFRVHEPFNDVFVIKLTINGNEYSNKFTRNFIFDELVEEVVKWVAYTIVKPSFSDVFVAMQR